MKRLFFRSQAVGYFKIHEEDFETCATADAQYDELTSRLIVELDSFTRPISILAREEHRMFSWLPKKHTVTESVSPDDAVEMANEIFQKWVKTVRMAERLQGQETVAGTSP